VADVIGVINLPAGVVGHEGSTLLVTLNGLRLLRGRRERQPPRSTRSAFPLETAPRRGEHA
jgi:hypothetical protein